MVLSRLFGNKQKSDAPSPPAPEPEAPDVSAESETEGLEGTADDSHDDWARRAARVIAGGASTGSKRVPALYGDAEEIGPTHFVRAAGCRVETVEGASLVDCTMALGSVALGYAEPQLTRAVIETIASGSVAGLSPVLEVEVAERLGGVIPCAEKVLFLKSGADAMSAAVRVARTHTGRDLIVGCGYFGWHDWASDAAGVPDATKALLTRVPFDDVPALERAVAAAGKRLAAVVIEPVIERLPSSDWVRRARELCDANGALLIFDEMKTGFRLKTGGYQEFAEIVPDLAAFGKAMANGHPIAALCGREEVMAAVDKTWISSTLASESGSLAAVAMVLAWHAKRDVCADLWSVGREMRERIGAAIQASGVGGVRVDGIDPMWLFRFDDPAAELRFLRVALEQGVMFKRGAYNFAALAHDEDALAEIEAAASAGFVALRGGDDEDDEDGEE